MLVHLPIDRTADRVRDALVETMATLPAHLKRSLTWDQGSETGRPNVITARRALHGCLVEEDDPPALGGPAIDRRRMP
ncbi:hypothetical protein GCM10010176_089070 [Nonomuraea spiralis]|nr:hypothetical protein GCM10010176_089070 [Nonomuraea spiralis]